MGEVPDVTGKRQHSFVASEEDRALGEAIKRARESKNLDQAELAKMAGIVARTLIRYEKAQRPVKVGTLRRLEEVLGPLRPSAQGKTHNYSEVSDPDRSLGVVAEPEAHYGGYTVRYGETDYIARKLDAIDDEQTRMRAMKACIDAISEALHPSVPGAHKSGSASRRSST